MGDTLYPMWALSPVCKWRHPDTVSPDRSPACTAFEVDKLALSRLVLAAQLPLLGVQPFPRHEPMLLFAWLCSLHLPLISEWDNHTRADSIVASLAVWKAQGCPVAPLFFIDGDHAYESVWRELSAVAAEVPGANVLLHDTFYQSGESCYNVGPHRAIEEVLRAHPGRYRQLDSGVGLPGMTLLYQLQP